MEQIQKILDKIILMLIRLGFVKTIVTNQYKSEINYVRGNLYCIPQYVESLGFLIEYANSYEEAKNHGHEDGDAFPLLMGENAILKGLEYEVRQVLGENSL